MPLEFERQQLRLTLIKDIPIDNSLYFIAKYREKSIEAGDQHHINFAKYYEAKYLALKGAINKSNSLLKSSIPFFIEKDCFNFLHASYNLLGRNKINQGNIEEGLKLFEQSINIPNISKENIANALSNVIYFLVQLGQFDRALKKCKEALSQLSLSDQIERPIYFKVLLESAEIFLHKKMPEKAFEIISKIEKVKQKHQIERLTSELNKVYGLYFTFLKEYTLAEKHFKLAIEDSFTKKYNPLLLSIKIYLSEVYVQQEKYKEAEELLLNAFTSYKQEEKGLFLNLLSNLINIYQIQGNVKEQKRFEKELDLNAD